MMKFLQIEIDTDTMSEEKIDLIQKLVQNALHTPILTPITFRFNSSEKSIKESE